MKLKRAQRVLIRLFTTANNSYYYVNPITNQTKWFQEIVSDLGRFFPLSQVDLYVVKHRPFQNQCTPKIQPKLVHYYITVNTNDRDLDRYPHASRFSIPVQSKIPKQLEIVNFVLHKAVIPKSQYVVDEHNCLLQIRYDTDLASSIDLKIPIGNYSAAQIATGLQNIIQCHIPSFTCSLDVTKAVLNFSAEVPFMFLLDACGDKPLCFYPVGLHPNNRRNPYWTLHAGAPAYKAQLDPDTQKYNLTTNHVDVSGCQLLMVRLNRFNDRLVGCIPLHDVCAPESIVYYENPTSGKLRRGWNHGHQVPVFHKSAECTVTDLRGREYLFHGLNCTFVFEVTCLSYHLSTQVADFSTRRLESAQNPKDLSAKLRK